MKSAQVPPRSPAGSLEVLEARIAPARVITVGIVDTASNGNDINYDTPGYFVDTFNGSDAISAAVGGYADFSKTSPVETFYLLLSPGDTLRVFAGDTQASRTDLIQVQAGKVAAFFRDLNHDNEVQQEELMSLAVSNGAQLVVGGGVAGSITSNLVLAPNGTTSLHLNDLVSASQAIGSIRVSGDVGGNIFSGGDIRNFSASNVQNLYAGTSALSSGPGDKVYTPFTGLEGLGTVKTGRFTSFTEGTTTTLPLPGQKGGSLLNLTLGTVDTINSGNGGAGGAGGDITLVQVQENSGAIHFLAGNGGAANTALGRVNGGAGGNISRLYISGFADSTPNDLIEVRAGLGGGATTGVGGAGGSISSTYVGAFLQNGVAVNSSSFVSDNVLIKAGDGGAGRLGGAGGNLNTVRSFTSTPNDPLLTDPNPAVSAEIRILAGNGGASPNNLIAGAARGGAGGQIINVNVQNQPAQSLPAVPSAEETLLVQSGAAGAVASPRGTGAVGGSITGATLLASNLIVTAGDGSAGATGGAGGNLTSAALVQTGSTFIHTAILNAGNGGAGTAGGGGAGGTTTNLAVNNGDFQTFSLNQAGAQGGSSTGGRGGAGGGVTGMIFLDSNAQQEVNTPLFGTLNLRTGAGGNGSLGGGQGGNLVSVQVEAVNLQTTILTGKGGNATVSGVGGAGGVIGALRTVLDGNSTDDLDGDNTNGFTPVAVGATITAGVGGSGFTRGGAGGSITNSLVRIFDAAGVGLGHPPLLGGDVAVTAGQGGSASNGAAGAGGSILATGAFTEYGNGVLRAGDAGAVSSLPAAGGAIQGSLSSALSALYAAGNVTILSGSGSGGGAGGAIRLVGYGSSARELTPVPEGNILIQAGNGSAAVNGGVNFAGVGGSISGVYGSVSQGAGSRTDLVAGQGGFSSSSTRAGDGGSISDVIIQRGPESGEITGELNLRAGSGGGVGQSPAVVNVTTGARGGSISNVQIREIGDGTIIRSLVAGDGGTGGVRGGAGGSIAGIKAENYDIGVRSGQPFGVATMGGIFAGLGGSGPTNGQAGNVTDVSANSITSITAGADLASPALANTVSSIKVNGTATLDPQLGTAFADFFQLTYRPPVALNSTVDGNAGTAEMQTFERVPGGSLAAVQPAGGPSTFVLTYQGQTTTPLDADASPQAIQNALNALPAIGANGVTVSENAQNHDFTVTFNGPGNRAQITGEGQLTTAPLRGTARVQEVQAALNQFSQVIPANGSVPGYAGFPGAQVLSSSDASFNITYNAPGANFGNVTGERILPREVTELVANDNQSANLQHVELLGTGRFRVSVAIPNTNITASTAPLNADATPAQVQAAVNAALDQAGIFTDVTVRAGARLHSYDFVFNGAAPLLQVNEFASFSANVTTTGSTTAAEVQALNFTPLRGVNDLVFTATRGTGDVVTIRVPADHYTSTAPTAAAVQAGFAAQGIQVNVTQAANNSFTFTPAGTTTLATVNGITAYEVLPTVVSAAGASLPTRTAQTTTDGDGVTTETQVVRISAATNSFTITFNGLTTAALAGPDTAAGPASAAQVDAALEQLAGNGGNNVSVVRTPVLNSQGTATGDYEYTISSTQPGNQASLLYDQAIAQTRLAVSNEGSFQIGNQILSANASAARVQQAFAAVGETTKVTQDPSVPNVFFVDFADGTPYTAVEGRLPLVGDADTSTPNPNLNRLSYQRQVTFTPDAYRAANLVGAIANFNQLGADKFSFIDVNGDGVFNLSLTGGTGDIPIDGLIAAVNFSQQTANFTPQARYIINSDATTAAGVYRPVDAITPGAPVFYDFANDRLA